MTASDDAIFLCGAERLAELATVAREAYSDHYLHFWEPQDNGRYYLELCFSDAAFARDYADPNVLLYGIEYEQQLIGYMKLNRQGQPAELPQLQGMELEKLYLRQSATGQGLGHAALALACDLARQSGQTQLWLKVMSSNVATVRFYERAGFVIRHRFRIDIPHMLDAMRGMYIMALPLS